MINYSKHCYSPAYKDSLLNGAAATAMAQGSYPYAYSERLDSGNNGSKDLWIRSFLINTKYNARGWAVDPSTILQNVYSIVGKPLVLDENPITGKADHPRWDTHKSAEANLLEQGKKAIGVVEKVFYDKETDSYYADSRVTDPHAREYIRQFHGKKVPIHVSPQLVYDSKTEQPNYYKNWQFVHLAVVDKPAYGPQAQAIGACMVTEKHVEKSCSR
jgi:hypothetical protein